MIHPDLRDPELVDALIARARTTPDGIELLLNGHHDSVAMHFGVHAFTLDAARDRLRAEIEAAELVLA